MEAARKAEADAVKAAVEAAEEKAAAAAAKEAETARL